MSGADADLGRYHRIYIKDPSAQAFAELLGRALDKARRPEQSVKVPGEVDVVHRLIGGAGPPGGINVTCPTGTFCVCRLLLVKPTW